MSPSRHPLWLVIWTIILSNVCRSASEPYSPRRVGCTSGTIIRPATALSAEELSYATCRKIVADQALATWLSKVWGPEKSAMACDLSRLPTLALAMSGGGPKAGLLAAGVMQGFDARDSSYPVSGLLQSMTYISALSGGSLTLGGVMGNDFAKISDLRNKLWNATYQDVGELPLENVAIILKDIAAKTDAGYPTTLVDVYGRILGYDFIGGIGGANNLTWSSITDLPAFTAYQAPYPIITQTNANVAHGHCLPSTSGAIWEVSPYEFGSWNASIQAFVPTKYLGTSIRNGFAEPPASCTVGFDNLGLLVATSADILVDGNSRCSSNGSLTGNQSTIAADLTFLGSPSLVDNGYGYVPNPFQGLNLSNAVKDQTALFMVDGGYSGQGIPIFPFLQPQRNIDVIFVADDESLNAMNVTDGAALYATYTTARQEGLSRMPQVPTNQTYTREDGASRASFFGCHDRRVATIIYMPDSDATGESSGTFAFTPPEIDAIIQAGINLVTQSNNTQWPHCVACAIMHKHFLRSPQTCTACLQKYCWMS